MSAPGDPEIIDAHFHLWSDPFPDRPFPWTPDPFPLESMTALFDAHGVSRGIDVTPIMFGWDNADGLESAARSNGRVSVFGRFDPLAPQPTDRLRQWMAQPMAAGVRLTFYGAGLADLDDPDRLEPFWAAAEALGVRVAVFAPDALWSIVEVAERHPDLRLIIDHLGLGVYPGCEEPRRHHGALARFADHAPTLVKISGAVEISQEPFPCRDVRDIVDAAREDFGADRLMWGSNYPVASSSCTYRECLEFVDECGFDDRERAAVLGGTAAAMLAETIDTVG